MKWWLSWQLHLVRSCLANVLTRRSSVCVNYVKELQEAQQLNQDKQGVTLITSTKILSQNHICFPCAKQIAHLVKYQQSKSYPRWIPKQPMDTKVCNTKSWHTVKLLSGITPMILCTRHPCFCWNDQGAWRQGYHRLVPWLHTQLII